ncbi:hypothetical protein ACLK19_22470 [Escherichia coli]
MTVFLPEFMARLLREKLESLLPLHRQGSEIRRAVAQDQVKQQFASDDR